ncbi:MAG TPA: hypothetical protein VFV67_02940 [Actinophytocola sp.]|uniref:hypothetical protein n=1 Tax=Actinophytocola sp. TaxID=1872138 RepID=UPI002DBA69C4|nr:hypothetical protein [Actinophytocola sp.]HEU5469583.1 hypothetical protein [Actinophytocola sp.]
MTSVDDGVEPGAHRRWANPLLLGAVALAVAAVVVAVWFGVSWLRASNDDTLARATARDEVDRVARQAIMTFQTLDYRKVDESLANWEAASTGDLHNDVAGRKESSRQAIVDAKTVTTAQVLSLAVTDLNEFEGKASVIAAAVVDVATEGQQPAKKYMRIQGALQRTADGWKLSAVGYVDPARS